MARDNRPLGKFHLVGLPPAPRGVPQIEVTFDIDANGIVNVSAKDLGTGKEQKITITASSGLSKDEVDRMMKEAEAHAEEDKKRREEIETRNRADQSVYAAEAFLKESGDKLAAADKQAIETATEALRKAIEANEAAGISRAMEELTAAQHKAAANLYQQASAAGAAGAPGGDGGNASRAGGRRRRRGARRERRRDRRRSGRRQVVTKARMDFYVVLGLGREATVGDIKRAYRRLARRYHPDINPGDRLAATQFRQIAEAYETLIDPDRRRRYDTGGSDPGPDEPRIYGFEGFDFSASAHGHIASTFGDLFAEVFRQRAEAQPGGEPERGADLHQMVTLSFAEAMIGGQRALTITRLHRCSVCRGAGWLRTAEHALPGVPGSGRAQVRPRAHGVLEAVRGLPGNGRPVGQPLHGVRRAAGRAPHRNADGRPPGGPGRWRSGARSRARGTSGATMASTATCSSPCASSRMACSRAKVTTCTWSCRLRSTKRRSARNSTCPRSTGRRKLRVPPGTQSGQRFRLRERGVPSARTGRRGDLVVEVRLVLPRVLDERSKELLREFGRLNGDDVRKDFVRGRVSDHEENGEGLLHDQRGGTEVQHPPADACACTSARGC